ncbi:MAG: NMD3-related protein [Candidatus Ranarchaeia archaeon]|jgi:NMD protein affecting ribosome stability and mRNA decay
MSPKVFCAECGKTGITLLANLCPDCYYRNNQPLKIKTPVTNKICPNCSATQRSHRWIIERKRKTTLDELLWRAAYIATEEAIQIEHPWNIPPLQNQLSIEISPEITEESLIEKKNRYLIPTKLDIIWDLKDSGKSIKKTIVITVEITPTLCNKCAQIRRGYVESTIQLRYPKKLRKPQRLERQNELVEEIFRIVERNPASAVTDQTQQSNGVDLSFNQKPIAYTIANYLKKRHKAVIKKSFKQIYFKHGEHLKKLVISAIIQ